MRVIIAAAGTAGHINPGLAIANEIKKQEKNSKIIFIGTTRGLENDLVPRAGYELKTIDAYGLSKKISIDNIKKMYKTLKGFGEAKKIIKEFKPDVVIGTGGYICGATIMGAHKLGIPTVLHESNAFPGKAVKMLSKSTDTILVSFKDAIPRIKGAKNIVYTGTPVKMDEPVVQHLKLQGYNFETVLPKNKRVFLRTNSNCSTGGESIDMTDFMPSYFKKIAEKASRAFEAKICGVDIIIDDVEKEEYSIIEINDNPGYSINEWPYEGEGEKIGIAILKLLDLLPEKSCKIEK